MAKHDEGTSSVNCFAEASVGDTVWLFDSQMNLHDQHDRYIGRGVWRLAKVESETRASFVVRGEKFDRKFGFSRPHNGYSTGNLIAGQSEKEDHLWLSANRYHLIKHLERCDAQTLRRVADLVGWAPPALTQGE